MEKFYCPLCGEEVKMSKHNDRDWCCINCVNPNCLNPSTGWNCENTTIWKWLKYCNKNNKDTNK